MTNIRLPPPEFRFSSESNFRFPHSAFTLSCVEVVGLGQASLDFLGSVASFPREDVKSELTGLEAQCGGPASTALVTLARFGIRTSFLGSISDDFFGKEILKGLQNEGVDFSCLAIRPGFTSQFAFIAISPAGRRTIFWHRGTAPPPRKEEVNLSRFPNARVLHLDGLMMEGSMEAARQAKRLGWKVVMDGGTLREGSLDLIRLVDVLIASEGFAGPISGEDAPPEKRLEDLRGVCPGTVIITLGVRGSIGCEDGKTFFQIPFPVDAVDTTGAGDVYHGAYIYGLLRGWRMPESMRFASATAALKCRSVGARRGIPTLDEVDRFMSEHILR
jgi:sulfofructose kinase